MSRYSKISPMSEEFHDWLEQCPTPWLWNGRDETGDYVVYEFKIDTKPLSDE